MLCILPPTLLLMVMKPRQSSGQQDAPASELVSGMQALQEASPQTDAMVLSPRTMADAFQDIIRVHFSHTIRPACDHVLRPNSQQRPEVPPPPRVLIPDCSLLPPFRPELWSGLVCIDVVAMSFSMVCRMKPPLQMQCIHGHVCLPRVTGRKAGELRFLMVVRHTTCHLILLSLPC